MLYYRGKVRDRYQVNVVGEKTEDMPMWVINNYLKATCDNYTKLVYIVKIIEAFSDVDSRIVNIGISTNSVPVDENGMEFEEKLIDKESFWTRNKMNKEELDEKGKGRKKTEYCLLLDKEDNNNQDKKAENNSRRAKTDFWYYFSNCERPVCFAITKDNEIFPLYNPRGQEGIKVCDISYHCPIDIGIEGIGGFIKHLTNARMQYNNNQREEREHQARMINQGMQTLQEEIKVQTLLSQAKLPEHIKVYMQNKYNALMDKQAKLNEQIGIKVRDDFDYRI